MDQNKRDNIGIHRDTGNKWAMYDIKSGEDIIMNDIVIGQAICHIRKGEYVHIHNAKFK